MTLNRRDFLRLAGLVASSAALASCSPVYTQLAKVVEGSSPETTLRTGDLAILTRLTYGSSSFDRYQVSTTGLTGWIEAQLAPEQIEDDGLNWRLRSLDFLNQEADALIATEKEDLIAGLKQASLLAKVYSRRQIYEQMVEFWSDHFNITVAKGDCWFLKVVDDRQVIRQHALGNFRDLLFASAHSPAMLVYLDNQVNEKSAPNENYARELMELHTMGVDSGYTQNDVMELARCLTGWTVKEHFWRGEFIFDPEDHDTGLKSVLNRQIHSGGLAEAESVLEDLAVHPATAHHLATKLVRRFVTDVPLQEAPHLVTRVADTFLKTRGDIPAVLRTLFLDGMAGNPGSLRPKYKRPLDFLASALRGLEATTNGGVPLQRYLSQMGQPLFEWPTPDGAPDALEAWIGNLMPRWKLALGLTRNEIEGTLITFDDLIHIPDPTSPESALDQLSERLLGGRLGQEARSGLLEAVSTSGRTLGPDTPAALAAGLIASPAFQWR